MMCMRKHIDRLYFGNRIFLIQPAKIPCLCGGVTTHINNYRGFNIKDLFHQLFVHARTGRISDDHIGLFALVNPVEAAREGGILDGVGALVFHQDGHETAAELGFEALLAGSSVICFGAPWYCGWGLTDDRGPPLPADSLGKGRRKALCSRPVCLDHLVDAAYLRYARYVDPATGYRQSPTQAFEQWQLNAAMAQAGGNKTEGRNFFVGFPRWKRATMRAYGFWRTYSRPSRRLFVDSWMM